MLAVSHDLDAVEVAGAAATAPPIRNFQPTEMRMRFDFDLNARARKGVPRAGCDQDSMHRRRSVASELIESVDELGTSKCDDRLEEIRRRLTINRTIRD